MKENELKSNDDIKVVLEKISSDDPTIVISNGSDDGMLEFRFEEAEKRGLVFEEDSASADSQSAADSLPQTKPEPSSNPTVAETKPEPSSNPTVAETKPADEASLKVEFEKEPEPIKDSSAVSETVDSVSAENTPVAGKTASPWATYLPRFTEVSETYRMNNDPRPRPEKKEKERIVVDSVKESEVEEPIDTDPTAESAEENAVFDAVVVNVSQKAEEVEEQVFSIYKFSEATPEAAPAEPERERTVEDELAEIEELFTRPAETEASAETEEETAAEEQDTEDPGDEDNLRANSYALPDPDSRVHIIDYTSVAAKAPSDSAEAPSGVEDPSKKSEQNERKTEFTAHRQRDFFKDKFLDSIMSTKIRLVAAIILTLATVVFENLGVFSARLESFLRFDTFSGAMAIADLQFALCVFILAIPEIMRAFRALARAIVVPEILPIVSLIFLSIYTVVIVAIAPPIYYPLFGTLCAVHSLSAIASSCFKRNADFMAFKRVSGKEAKTILDVKMTRALERENLALDGAVDETKSKTARLFKTSFVTDFFKRSSSTVENPRNVIISLAVSLVSAIIGFVIAYFVGNGLLDAVTVFTAVALLTLPAVSVLLHKLAFYHSSLESESEENAVIGEGSIYEYSGVDVIAFEDTDIFGSEDVNLKRIIHYGDVDNVMKAMRQMSAIFANFGGPLSIIFSNSLDRKCLPAQNPEIEPDGIAGIVDGRMVRAGTAGYMQRHGITIPDSAASAYAGTSDSTKIMYGAEDGAVYVQFHIRYSFSEEFTMILPTLKKEGIVPLIYTRDPNVSAELISTLTSGEDCIRVLKKNTVKPSGDNVYKRVSTGIVTSGDKMNAMNAILLAKKYVRLMKKLSVIELVAMGAGCILSAILAIAGQLGISSIIFLGWHFVWFFILYVVSRKTFTVKKKEESTDDR